nr:hypothetical protein [Tanacetum cinerariifolium]
MLENGPWFIRSHLIILKKWNLDVNILKEDVRNVSVWVKIHGVPVTTFREDGLSERSSYARAMIELQADVELKDTIVVVMAKINGKGLYTCLGVESGETKNPKKTSQALKKDMDSTSKVSDSNPFEVLNSVDNDVEMGTNGGTSNLDKNGVNSSGSSFWNVKNSSTSTVGISLYVTTLTELPLVIIVSYTRVSLGN